MLFSPHLPAVHAGKMRWVLKSASSFVKRRRWGARKIAVTPYQSSCVDYLQPYLASFRDVIVKPNSGLILTRSGKALSDEIYSSWETFGLPPKNSTLSILRRRLKTLLITDAVNPHEIACGVHLMKEHESNYFHWIVEVLPRLFVTETLLADTTIPLLVTDGLHPNLYSLLDMIKNKQRSVVKLNGLCWYRVGALTYPSEISRILDTYEQPPSRSTIHLPMGILAQLRLSLQTFIDSCAGPDGRKLFVKRGGNYRKLTNEDEIETRLREYGFEGISMGDLNIDQQVAAFSRASVIVGPSSASFANILWCAPQAKILVLHSDHPYKKYPYWDDLAAIAKANISYLAGPRAYTVTDKFAVHDDFSIDPASLLEQLRLMNVAP